MLTSNFFFLKEKLMIIINARDFRLDLNRQKKINYDPIITKKPKKP